MKIRVVRRRDVQICLHKPALVLSQCIFHRRAGFQSPAQFEATVEHAGDDLPLFDDLRLPLHDGCEGDGLTYGPSELLRPFGERVREDLVKSVHHPLDDTALIRWYEEIVGIRKQVPLEARRIHSQSPAYRRILRKRQKAKRIRIQMFAEQSSDLISSPSLRNRHVLRRVAPGPELVQNGQRGVSAAECMLARFDPLFEARHSGQYGEEPCVADDPLPLQHPPDLSGHHPPFEHDLLRARIPRRRVQEDSGREDTCDQSGCQYPEECISKKKSKASDRQNREMIHRGQKDRHRGEESNDREREEKRRNVCVIFDLRFAICDFVARLPPALNLRLPVFSNRQSKIENRKSKIP